MNNKVADVVPLKNRFGCKHGCPKSHYTYRY